MSTPVIETPSNLSSCKLRQPYSSSRSKLRDISETHTHARAAADEQMRLRFYQSIRNLPSKIHGISAFGTNVYSYELEKEKSYYQTSSGRKVFADYSSCGCGTGELVGSQYTRSGGVCQIYGSCWASQGCKYVGIARLPISECLAIRTAPCSCTSRCQSKNRLSISDDWNEEIWFHDRGLLNRIASPFLRQKPPMILFFFLPRIST